MKEDFPDIRELVVGSDNGSGLASHDNVPHVHHLNKIFTGIRITNWVHTEACTGENGLDTHFSFLNISMIAHIGSGKNILTEKDICLAPMFKGGIAGSTAVLFDGAELEGPVARDKEGNEKEFKASNTGVRETHEIIHSEIEWPEVLTISEITEPENISKTKMNNGVCTKLGGTIVQSSKSDKQPLQVPKEKKTGCRSGNELQKEVGEKARAVQV